MRDSASRGRCETICIVPGHPLPHRIMPESGAESIGERRGILFGLEAEDSDGAKGSESLLRKRGTMRAVPRCRRIRHSQPEGSLGLPLSGKCALQAFDIEFLHLQHGLKGPLGFCGVRIGEQLRQDLGYNLPGEAKLILQPAALLRLRIAALGQPLPVVIHFLLSRALNLKRDGLVELENRSTIERGEGLSVQLKGHRQHRPGRLPVDFLSGLRIARDGDDFRVFENGGVKAGGVFGLVVEPQAGADLCGHDFSVVLGFRNVIVHLVDEQEVRVRTSGANFSKSWHESTCEMLLAYAGIVWSYGKSRAKSYAK
jgi:hypothetical protein